MTEASEQQTETDEGVAPATCPNCGGRSSGRFCAVCGQDNRRSRLDSKALLGDALQNLVGWDSALVRTLRGLARAPGDMAADFVGGRRRRYVNPARFCLLSLALWFLSARVLGLDPVELSGISITNKAQNEHASDAAALREFVARYLEVLLYLALPLQALLLRWLFRSSRRNLAECLVLVLFVAGFSYLARAALHPLHLFGWEWVKILSAGVGLWWLIWAARRFFGKSWWGTSWRVLLALALHMFGTVLLFMGIAVPFLLVTGAI